MEKERLTNKAKIEYPGNIVNMADPIPPEEPGGPPSSLDEHQRRRTSEQIRFEEAERLRFRQDQAERQQQAIDQQHDTSREQRTVAWEQLRQQGKHILPYELLLEMWAHREGVDRMRLKEDDEPYNHLSQKAKEEISKGNAPESLSMSTATPLGDINKADIISKSDSARGLTNLKSSAERGELGALLRAAARTTTSPERQLEFQRALEDIANATDFGTASRIAKEAVSRANSDIIAAKSQERYYRLPQSIQEVAELIMEGEDPAVYGEGGTHPILENGKKFRSDNFLRWVRDKMIFYHEFDPDNQVDFMQQVRTLGPFRNISLVEMLQYSGLYFKDRDSGLVMEDLASQVLLESWLFGQSRNWDVQYRLGMTSDEKLPQLIDQMFIFNTFTKQSFGKNTLEWVLTAPKEYLIQQTTSAGGGQPAEAGQRQEQREQDQSIGIGIRAALMTYYHIQDKSVIDNIYHEIKGKNPLFMKDFYLDTVKTKNEQGDSRTKAEIDAEIKTNKDNGKIVVRDIDQTTSKSALDLEVAKKLLTPQNLRDRYSSTAGYFKDGYLDENNDTARKGFMKYLNVFNSIEKDEKSIGEVRERIRQALMAIPGLNLSYLDAKYAESFAFTMTRWMGAGARNDIFPAGSDIDTAVGSDAWSKVLNFDKYWVRQVSRQAPLGMRYQLAGFRRLGVDFLEGIQSRDRVAEVSDLAGGDVSRKGRTLLEIIQGGSGAEVDIKKRIEGVVFDSNTMRQFSGMHVANSFAMFHRLLETVGMGLDKFAKYDTYGRLVIDEEAVTKAFRDFYKNMRYAYSTWQLKYDAQVRSFRRDMDHVDPKSGRVDWTEGEHKTMTLLETMFSREILNIMGDKDTDHALFILNSGRVNKRTDEKILRKYLKGQYDNVKDKSDADIVAELRKNINSFVQTSDRHGSDFVPLPKRIMMHMINAEIWYHRQYDSGAQWWEYADLARIYDFLATKLPNSIFISGEDLTTMRATEQFFKAKELKAMRKKTRTEESRIFWKNEMALKGPAFTMLNGLRGMAKETGDFFKSVFSNI